MATLLDELAERKLLDDTLVIWMGEFGRSPKINQAEGRDHHPGAWSAVLAGGVAAGQVYGAADEDAAKVGHDPIAVPDWFATISKLLGIDPARELMSPVGRPIAISDKRQPIAQLIRASEGYVARLGVQMGARSTRRRATKMPSGRNRAQRGRLTFACERIFAGSDLGARPTRKSNGPTKPLLFEHLAISL
jgi:arylsulfatase A-like enzyme